MKCPMCDKSDVFLCPTCLKPITTHTHENDYLCEVHSFVNPIRQSDGKRVDGLGDPGLIRILN